MEIRYLHPSDDRKAISKIYEATFLDKVIDRFYHVSGAAQIAKCASEMLKSL